MRSPYKPAEIKAAIALKNLSTIGLTSKMEVSRRTLDYFINGGQGMRKGAEFIELLQPELDEVRKIEKRVLRRKLHICEVG